MKKYILLFFFFALLATANAQAPNQINYQAVARNSVGNVLPNQPIAVRLSLRDGSATGTTVYSEVRNVTTNAFGLFSFGIGSPGAVNVSGSLATVNWGSGSKYLQLEIDPAGGINFVQAGTSQLLSVPYALFAANASTSGPAGGSLTGTYPNPTIANGAVTSGMLAAGVIPTSLPPNGPAGGSLTGTYPNPTIANGAVTAGMLAPGVIPTGLPPSGTAGGDLTGTFPNPTVARLRGININAAAPTTNQVLQYNGTDWAATNSPWIFNGTNIVSNNTGSVGIGGNPVASAVLDINSTTQGVLVPRMNSVQRAAIGSPAPGLLVYDTDTNTFWYHNGTAWTNLAASASGGVGPGTVNQIAKFTAVNAVGNSLIFDDGTNVGINTTTPNNKLHIKQSVANRAIQWQHETVADFWSVGIGTNTLNCRFEFNGVLRGQIASVDGAYIAGSDFRLKEDIQPIGQLLNKIMQLKASSYYYKDSKAGAKNKSLGFIAQDVEKLFPELVYDMDGGMKGLNYAGFSVIAIKAIQEQEARIKLLEEKLNQLTSKQ